MPPSSTLGRTETPTPGTTPPPAGGPSSDRGEWTIDTNYNPGDVVTRKGKRYRALKPHQSDFIINPEYANTAGEAAQYWQEI